MQQTCTCQPRPVTHKSIILFLIAMFFSIPYADAQIMQQVTHANGTSVYGNTAVTVNPTNGSTQANVCIPGMYMLYASASNDYNFSLSRPTDHIRFRLETLDESDVVSFSVNGQAYGLNYSELSIQALPSCTCDNFLTNLIINNNGHLEDTGSNETGCVIIDIYEPGIDSFNFSFVDLYNLGTSGVRVAAYFEEDTSAFIAQPFTDTVLCPGDTLPLVYETSFAFNANNTFTAQLSNASGSFASPVNIGSWTDTTGDTIMCVIPTSMPAGAGYRVRIVSSSPADTSLDNQEDIRIRSTVAGFSNMSNTPVCTGDTLHLMGNSTGTGVTWAWTGPNSFGSAAEDTFIANSTMSAAGDYILKATLNSSGCSLSDTATVVMKPTPAKPTAVSNSPVCEFSSLQLAVSSSTAGVSYNWVGPNSYTNNTASPTIANMGGVNAGDYIGTATLNGCSSSDTVTVIVNPKPNKPTASAPNSPLCARQDLQLNASTINGATYTWYGPTSFTANTQNPTRSYVQLADTGYYYVYATINGCPSDTDSIRVVVNTDPFVNVFPTPGASICVGDEATFTAVPTNGGTTSYDWHLNGSSTGQTGLTYKTSTLNNGDKVYVLMTSTGTCATPFTDTSNEITMAVMPTVAPSVSISANPNTSLHPNEPITFTATPTDAGTTPTYQWRRNGKDVGGATGATWGANANFLSDGDEVCVLLTSSHACPEPDTALSNCIDLDIRVSVEEIGGSSKYKVYPNPVKASLYLSPKERGLILVQVYDVTGRIVYAPVAEVADGYRVDMSMLSAGNYILKIEAEEDVEYVKVVKE